MSTHNCPHGMIILVRTIQIINQIQGPLLQLGQMKMKMKKIKLLFMPRIEVFTTYCQNCSDILQTAISSNFYSPKISILLVLNSPARLLNDTTAIYLWSSSTVSVVLIVSILVSVS